MAGKRKKTGFLEAQSAVGDPALLDYADDQVVFDESVGGSTSMKACSSVSNSYCDSLAGTKNLPHRLPPTL